VRTLLSGAELYGHFAVGLSLSKTGGERGGIRPQTFVDKRFTKRSSCFAVQLSLVAASSNGERRERIAQTRSAVAFFETSDTAPPFKTGGPFL
jgi:hypothetical protein